MARYAIAALILNGFLTVPSMAGVPADPVDCSSWTLDGYRLGMRGDSLLAVRSVTLHVAGQAEASEPGRFHGVLVLDGLNSLTKWEVTYQTQDAGALRAEIKDRVGEPVSEVAGNVIDTESETVRQRRTIWLSKACDAAIIVYENTGVRGTAGKSVSAALTRASLLPQGIATSKTLFP